jgi:tRNA dimethylallyltransferase
MSFNSPLIVLIGPTAVGKTQTAIQLAEQLGGEIVSADSRLFYRGMDIGTAKPTRAEQARIPHYLIDVADPDQIWSLAIFQKAAQEVIADIHAKGKVPVLAGGTGQYVRAVTHGWIPPRVEPDKELRGILEKLARQNGNSWLHEKLRILDPRAAERIDSRNVRRTIRALEVTLTSGRLFSEQSQQSASPYRLVQIGLNRPRKVLYQRVDERIEAMFAQGFLDEVKELLAKGYSPDLPTMSAIGYRECIKVLKGEMDLEQAKQEMRKTTRNFIRRQANWFKPDDPEIKWFEVGENTNKLIVSFIHETLGN